MIPPFEEELQKLLTLYANYNADEIISALELALMAAKEQQAAAEDNEE